MVILLLVTTVQGHNKWLNYVNLKFVFFENVLIFE